MEDEQQEIFYKFQALNQQSQQIEQQIQAVENHKMQMTKLSENVGDIKGNEGKSILAEIGSGIYAKAELKDDKLIMNVGQGKFVEKSIDEVKAVLGDQRDKLEGLKQTFIDNIEEINAEMRNVISEAEKSRADGDAKKEKDDKKDSKKK